MTAHTKTENKKNITLITRAFLLVHLFSNVLILYWWVTWRPSVRPKNSFDLAAKSSAISRIMSNRDVVRVFEKRNDILIFINVVFKIINKLFKKHFPKPKNPEMNHSVKWGNILYKWQNVEIKHFIMRRISKMLYFKKGLFQRSYLRLVLI